jgi:hypothetical protein
MQHITFGLIHVGTRVLRVRSLGAGTPVVYAHGAAGSILEQPVPEAVGTPTAEFA